MHTSKQSTLLRHPLAAKKTELVFEREHHEFFEVMGAYTIIEPIARGTYGFVAKAEEDITPPVKSGQKSPHSSSPPPSPQAQDDSTAAAQDGAEEEDAEEEGGPTRVAIKKIPQLFSRGDSRMWLCTVRELQMLQGFEHDNVMSARDVFIPLGDHNNLTLASIATRRRDFDEVYVVMECLEYTLRSVLDSNRLKFFYRRYVLFQLLRGMGYIHACGVIHRDLKPENILMDDSYTAKICDFGQGRGVERSTSSGAEEENKHCAGDVVGSSVVCDSSQQQQQQQGSPSPAGIDNETIRDTCTQWYAGPETLTLNINQEANTHLDSSIFHSADVWSIGCIAAEMLIGRPIFETARHGGLMQLTEIIKVMGMPTDEDVEACAETEEDVILFKSSIPKNLPKVSTLRETLEEKHMTLVEEIDEDDENTQSLSLSDLEEMKKNELDLILSMLQYDPRKRINIDSALKHPLFTDIIASYAEYDIPVLGTPRPLTFIPKSELNKPERAREEIWSLFVKYHPEVTDLVDALERDETRKMACHSGVFAGPPATTPQ